MPTCEYCWLIYVESYPISSWTTACGPPTSFNNETAVWGRQWNESSLGTLRMPIRLPVRVCGTGSRSPSPVTLDVLARWQSGLGEVLDLAKRSLYVLLQVMTNSFVGGPPSRPIWSFAIKFGMCIRLSPLSKTITRSIPRSESLAELVHLDLQPRSAKWCTSRMPIRTR